MPLNRLILPMLLAIGTLLCSVNTQAEEALTLHTPLLDAAPLTLSSGRNVQLTLVKGNDPQNGDLWQRVRNGFAMRELDSALIAKHEQWYADRPEYVARMMDRAGLYLYYITSEVERRGMPSEIALLPMIESAFNPGAYSTSSASGIWQFIPSTGKHFGLKQNWWYDGRRDIISATTSALDYLEKLHTQFGDWQLALAAYNWGEGSVARAQERNRKLGFPTDYASLTMPDETRNYVPKLLAIKNIVSDPARFGLTLPVIANEPFFASVSTAHHIDVKLAAQLADISKEEFIALNPAHNRPVILQSNSDYILLPMDKIETFLDNLENYDKPLVSWQAYHAKKGERLDSLAPRFGLSVEKLKQINGMSAHSHLSSGDTLLVPLNTETNVEESQFAAFNMQLHPFQTSHAVTPTLHRGKTLSRVARRHQDSIARLQDRNGHVKSIRTGRRLNIVHTGSGKTRTAHSAKHGNPSASHKIARDYARNKHAANNRKIDLAYQNR